MCVCVCVRVYVYVYVSVSVCMLVCVCMHACLFVCFCVAACTFMYMRTCSWEYVLFIGSTHCVSTGSMKTFPWHEPEWNSRRPSTLLRLP